MDRGRASLCTAIAATALAALLMGGSLLGTERSARPLAALPAPTEPAGAGHPLREGQIDVNTADAEALTALPGVGPARAEAMRMSNVYRADSTGYGFLVRSSDGEKYNSLESLKDAVVITQSGSVQESLYNQYVNGACKEFKLVANMTDGYLAVAEGKADVCICSTASADLYASANGGLVTTGFRFEVDPNMNGTCVAMPMDGTESLAEFVNQCIEELNKEGKIDAWYEEYSAKAAELGIQ